MKTHLLVNISDLASQNNIIGFSLLTSDIEKAGYILDKKSITDNLLVLVYESEERAKATQSVLKVKGIRSKVQKTIKRKILPLNLEEVDYSKGLL